MNPDQLRIRHTPEMEALGIAGLVGVCLGESIPSYSGVDVVGPSPSDFAVYVDVAERDCGYWVDVSFIDPPETDTADMVEEQTYLASGGATGEEGLGAREGTQRQDQGAPPDAIWNLLRRIWRGL